MPEEVLRRVSEVESRLDPLAVHDNTTHISIHPASQASGAELARRWLDRGDSVDIGLMQINFSNLTKLGLRVETALDPCYSLKASARILSAAYAQRTSAADRQAALLIALSRYNTGRALVGLANGYVEHVLTAQSDTSKADPKSTASETTQGPDWDVWALASVAQQDGALWLIGSQDLPNFLIGAGAQPTGGEPHALSSEPGTAPGM